MLREHRLVELTINQNLIMIFGSIIGATLNYTRRGQVSPTPEELVGTPAPMDCLRTHMIIDDEEWPKLLRD